MADETRDPANASNDIPQGGSAAGAPLNSAQQGEGAPVSLSDAPHLPASPAPEIVKPVIADDIAKILKEAKLPEKHEFRAAADVAPAAPAPAPALVPAPEEAAEHASSQDKPAPESSSVVAMHTLKQDLQHVVHDQKISVVRAASLEQERKHQVEPLNAEPAPGPGNHTVALIAGAALLLLGAGALLGVYIVVVQNSSPLPKQASDSLVFAEQNIAFPLSGKTPSAIKNELAQARNASNASLGSITRVVPAITTSVSNGATGQRPATLSEFLGALGTHAPGDLLRALGDTYFFGIHTVDENAPVFVITVTSYDRAFAGMLAWEKDMNADLSPAFTPVSALTTDGNGLPTERVFSDLVMRNYDVRALKDDSGTIQLYYSFPTRGILIIGESPYTFTEILGRLQAGRKL